MSQHASRNTVIESLGVYLPPEIASTREVLAGCGQVSLFQRAAAKRVEQLIGIKNRRVAADSEPASEMAAKAIANCMATSGYHPSEIDLFIYCSISRYAAPKHYVSEPGISIGLAAQFHFRNALALDISNGCAGMFTAINIADALIKSGLVRVAMIVSGEHITDLLKTAQKETTGYTDVRFACLTLGDAAAALILKQAPDDTAGFHSLELYTVAQYSDCCIGKPTPASHGGAIMYTESAKLLDVAENYAIPDIVRALDTLQWGKQELDHLISHQTAQRAIDTLYAVNRLAKREILHDGNVVNNLAERGNTASTSHFVALWDHVHNGSINTGDRLLFAIQGSGMTIGTAAYTLDDLPDRLRLGTTNANNGNGHVRPAAFAPNRTRAILKPDAPRVRIESLGTANCDTPSSGMELAQRAMDDCLAASSYRKENIDLLIYAGVNRDEFIAEPAIAALIAGRSMMNDTGSFPIPGQKTLAFDVYNGSMGFLNACYLGAGMIRAGRVKSVMVVAAEIEPNVGRPEWDQMGTVAAGSVVILDSPANSPSGFGHCIFETFPEYTCAFTSWLTTKQGNPRMHIEKHADLEAIYLKCIPRAVEELLRCERLCMDDIKVILPPQISRSFLPGLADALDVETCRFVSLAADPGIGGRSLSSSSIAHAFKKARCRGAVAPGDIGLMISVGSGLQVGAATYYF
jgi:3-oxoacyl-[acyl-carrier-protein] synthase III